MASSTLMKSPAVQALRKSVHPALRLLSIEETGETIVISGRVSSWYLKQLAQETIMPHRGILELVNHVQVVRD